MSGVIVTSDPIRATKRVATDTKADLLNSIVDRYGLTDTVFKKLETW